VATDGAILPHHDLAILDEAHAAEDILAAANGAEINGGRFRALRRVASGILTRSPELDNVDELAGRFDDALVAHLGKRLTPAEDPEVGPLLELADTRLEALQSALRALPDDASTKAKARAQRCLLSTGSLLGLIRAIRSPGDGDVTWVEGSRSRPVLCMSPVAIADVLAEIAWLDSFNVSMTWTGLQGSDPHRPALTVKIDNASAARPQTGINEADVVYEEIVEAGLTRFVAIFQSTSPGTVGPVRSGRTSDPILLEGFDRPLFAYSGANRGTNQAINASPLVDVGYDNAASAYWRSSSRRAPHNLYASTDSLWALHADRTDVPPAPFTFGWEGQPLPDSAIAAEGVTIDFGRLVADYAWDGSGWQRSTNGEAHSDAEGVRVAPTNVVVQFTTYGKSAADNRSPEARTTGSGTAWVFTAGHLMVAEWNRPDPGRPATITIDGEPVLLQPGRTWVALADAARPGNVAWR